MSTAISKSNPPLFPMKAGSRGCPRAESDWLCWQCPGLAAPSSSGRRRRPRSSCCTQPCRYRVRNRPAVPSRNSINSSDSRGRSRVFSAPLISPGLKYYKVSVLAISVGTETLLRHCLSLLRRRLKQAGVSLTRGRRSARAEPRHEHAAPNGYDHRQRG